MRLETARLTLRPFQDGDVQAVQSCCHDHDVAQFMRRVPHPFTLADAEDFVARVFPRRGQVWAVILGEELVGMVGTVGEFGYWIGRARRQQGIATEAASVVLDHYFSAPENEAIAASYMDDNQGSARLLARLGFVVTGRTMLRSLARPAPVPGNTLRLTRQRWLEKQNA